MIKSFRHRGLKRLFEDGDGSCVPSEMRERIEDVLVVVDAASTPRDMVLPGFRLHRLKGDLKSFWSVRVTANWRIVFRFDGEDACDVDLLDYH